MLLRIFERPIEIRDLRSQSLLRTHARVERHSTEVLPMGARVFNPSHETHFILSQSRFIGPQTALLCEILFAIQGWVCQRKLQGIDNLARRYPNRFIDAACADVME